MVLMRDAAPSIYMLAPRSRTLPSGTPPILPIPLPTSSLPLPLPSTDRRADVPEAVDRYYHANTALLVEREDMITQEAWAQSMDASHKARSEVMILQTTVSALQTENGKLRAADDRHNF
nr:hypothetical protein [Tanacetum cinerariifolium]